MCERLEAEKIAFGPVLKLHEVLTDAQMMARRMTLDVDSPTGGATRFVRQPLVLNGNIGQIVRAVPELGEHNAELLSGAAKA